MLRAACLFAAWIVGMYSGPAHADPANEPDWLRCGSSHTSAERHSGFRPGFEETDTTYGTEHFLFHYSTADDEHRLPGYPDRSYLLTLADAFEESYRTFTVEMGFRAPLPDRVSIGSPDERIDVYIFNLPQNYAGLARPVLSSQSDLDCNLSESGFVRINVDVNPRSLATLAAHELFHIIQYSYDAWLLDSWFMESTAVWASLRHGPQPASHSVLFHYLIAPHLHFLTEFPERFRYGGAIFWHFHEDYFDDRDFVRRVFDRTCGRSWRSAYESELHEIVHPSGRPTRLNDLIPEFAAWNYFTGARDQGEHYREGDEYAPVRTHRSHRTSRHFVEGAMEAEDPQLAQITGSNYVRIENHPVRDERSRHLRFDFLGRPELAPDLREVTWILERDPRVFPDQPRFETRRGTVLEGGSATLTVPNWDEMTSATLIVTHLEGENWSWPGVWDRDLYAFRYRAEQSGDRAILSPLQVRPFPNPSSSEVSFDITIDAGSGSSSLQILDLRGREVGRIDTETLAPGRHVLQWQGRDRRGRPLPSGVYFYRFERTDGQATGKLHLLR